MLVVEELGVVERGPAHVSVALVHYANVSYRVGRRLTIDPKTWEIVNDAEANGMLTRDYREPYVVPEKV